MTDRFTTADLARLFHVPPSTIRRWAAEESWPCTMDGHRTTYTAAQIEVARERLKRRIEAEDRRRAKLDSAQH